MIDPGTLDPNIWIQAGAVGVLALFVIVMTLSFFAYITRRDKQLEKRDEQWRLFLNKTHRDFKDFLTLEKEQRKDAMQLGMNDVEALTRSVSELAKAMGEHDLSAQVRHAQVLSALTRLEQVHASAMDIMLTEIKSSVGGIRKRAANEVKEEPFVET
jgi:hypothetical protein